jgi:nucleotide-binding universal stress UspA family protein
VPLPDQAGLHPGEDEALAGIAREVELRLFTVGSGSGSALPEYGRSSRRKMFASLGANSRSGLAENFIGSTTREFLVHAPSDILVAHLPG